MSAVFPEKKFEKIAHSSQLFQQWFLKQITLKLVFPEKLNALEILPPKNHF